MHTIKEVEIKVTDSKGKVLTYNLTGAFALELDVIHNHEEPDPFFNYHPAIAISAPVTYDFEFRALNVQKITMHVPQESKTTTPKRAFDITKDHIGDQITFADGPRYTVGTIEDAELVYTKAEGAYIPVMLKIVVDGKTHYLQETTYIHVRTK
jgi:hypothetical protein